MKVESRGVWPLVKLCLLSLVVGVSLGVYQLITHRNHSCSPLRTAPHQICPSTCWWVRGSLPFLAVRSKASVIIPVHILLWVCASFS